MAISSGLWAPCVGVILHFALPPPALVSKTEEKGKLASRWPSSCQRRCCLEPRRIQVGMGREGERGGLGWGASVYLDKLQRKSRATVLWNAFRRASKCWEAGEKCSPIPKSWMKWLHCVQAEDFKAHEATDTTLEQLQTSLVPPLCFFVKHLFTMTFVLWQTSNTEAFKGWMSPRPKGGVPSVSWLQL